LQFHFDDQTRAVFSKLSAEDRSPTGMEFDEMEHPRGRTLMFLVVTHQGLCFRYSFNGFWFLPFSDIDTYLKTHPADKSDLSTAATPQKGSQTVEGKP